MFTFGIIKRKLAVFGFNVYAINEYTMRTDITSSRDQTE